MISKRTYQRLKEVVDSGDRELASLMFSRSINAAHIELRRRQGRLSPVEKTAAVFGISVNTYNRAKAVVENGNRELIDLMNQTSVWAAYSEMKRREKK
jgi:hypothetical protein